MGRLTLRALPGLAKRQGRHKDGDGLSLRVLDGDRRYWGYRFRCGGKETEISLGTYPKIGLDEARRLHAAARAKVLHGEDPRAEKRARRASKIAASTATGIEALKPTFGQIAEGYVETHERSWRSTKHRVQWRNSLRAYCAGLYATPVDQIDTAAVLAVLKPAWASKPETAARVRGRIEIILNAARALGHIDPDRANPARWKGHLDQLLPKRPKLARGNHTAMPYADLPAFMVKLSAVPGTAARALEFLILTAARSGEVLGAQWDEIDRDGMVWAVPATRMKAAKQHRVPLSEPAAAILRRQLEARHKDHPYVFPGQRPRRGLNGMALAMAMRRLGAAEFTVHGMRSAFRDWAGDRTDFAREIAEAALAHQVGNAVEAAYRRGDALMKRRELMTAWAAFLTGDSAAETAETAVPLARRAGR
jgi:integrase